MPDTAATSTHEQSEGAEQPLRDVPRDVESSTLALVSDPHERPLSPSSPPDPNDEIVSCYFDLADQDPPPYAGEHGVHQTTSTPDSTSSQTNPDYVDHSGCFGTGRRKAPATNASTRRAQQRAQLSTLITWQDISSPGSEFAEFDSNPDVSPLNLEDVSLDSFSWAPTPMSTEADSQQSPPLVSHRPC
jgi:hypothetical protein